MSKTQCCRYDHNHDGNCHIHSAPGVLRSRVTPAKPQKWEVVSRSGTQICANLTEAQARNKVENDMRNHPWLHVEARPMAEGPDLPWCEPLCED